MRHSRLRSISCFLFLLGSFAMSGADAEEGGQWLGSQWLGGQWLLQTGLYTVHWDPDPGHVHNPKMLNLEYQRTDRWLVGAAVFDNSFGQPSQYVYFGKLWRPFESHQLVHTKLTGGLMHGYKDEYQSKIPLNSNGIAPVLVPAIGLSGKHVSGEVAILGTAGVTFTIGVLF